MKSILTRSIYILLLVTTIAGCKKGEPEITTEEERILAISDIDISDIYNFTKLTYLYNEKFIAAYPTFDDFAKKLKSSCRVCSDYEIRLEAVDMIRESSKGLDRFSYVFPENGLPAPNGEVLDDDDPRAGLDTYEDRYGSGIHVNTKKEGYFLVTWVDKDSPAYNLGIKRGMRIVSINGKASGNYSDKGDARDFLTGIQPFELVTRELKLDQNGVDISVPISYKITPKEYTYNPVAVTKVLNNNTGYMVLSTFTNNVIEKIEFKIFFERLRKENLSNLILDLRYNGGGKGTSADNLVNNILPRQFNGQKLNETLLNSNFRTALNLTEVIENPTGVYSANILKHPRADPYQWLYKYNYNNERTGKQMFLSMWGMYRLPLQIEAEADSPIRNVYILISKETASASELLINNLRPYVNVILIGTPTDGKQVGFYPFTMAKFKFNLVTFSHSNKSGQVVPAEGFQPGVYKAGKDQSFESLNSEELNIKDDATYDFGSNDPLVKKALELISRKIPN